MAKTFFEAIGYRLGQKAVQAKNAFDLVGGTEEESSRSEIRLGREMAAALRERTPMVEENESTRYAVQIGLWLAASVKERKFPFSFSVTAEGEPTAYALPGGPVFMSWPLLELCQGQRDEIAFALSHEMGHIALRHALDKFVKDTAFSLLLRQSSVRRAAGAWLARAGRQALGSAYSKQEELEADAFAVALIRTAGGDTSAAERWLAKLDQPSGGQSAALAGDYFATHPPVQERVAHLRAGRSA